MPAHRRLTLVLLVALAGATSWAPGVAQARPASGGYWLAGADGGVFSYGAPFYGSGVRGAGRSGAVLVHPPAAQHARTRPRGAPPSAGWPTGAATGCSIWPASPPRSAGPGSAVPTADAPR